MACRGVFDSVPQTADDCTDRISAMCLSAMREGFIDVTPGRSFSLLALDDAVQFVFQAAAAAEHRKTVYQIASGTAVTEKELANLIQAAFAEIGKTAGGRAAETADIRIVEKSGSGRGSFDVVPGNDAFREEFGINRLLSPEDGVRRTVAYMLEHGTVFMQAVEEKPSFRQRLRQGAGLFFRALVPFLENAACSIPFFLLDRWAGDSAYFSNINFSLLYVVLFACVYGQQQAVFSAVLAAAGRFLSQLPDSPALTVLSDYNTYVWIAQLFIIGLAAGYLRDRLTLRRNEAEEDHVYMAEQLKDIEEINKVNVRVKDSLQMQIINEDNSLGKIYEITSALDKYSADEVLFYAAEVLEKIIGTPDVSIYRISGGDYARLFTATSKKARTLGSSVRYKDLGDLSDSVEKKKVFINRELDPSLPMMAGAIYEEDELRYLLLIWTLSWEKMTLGEADLLAVTGFLIQNAVLHADRYLEAIRSERYIEDSKVMKPEAFRELVASYERAKDRNLTTYVLLVFSAGGKDLLADSEALSKKIRPNDYLGQAENGALCALLTNTDREGADIVMSRFAEAGFSSRLVTKEELYRAV